MNNNKELCGHIIHASAGMSCAEPKDTCKYHSPLGDKYYPKNLIDLTCKGPCDACHYVPPTATCRFGHECTSGCGNDYDCPCQSEHCCALTEHCEGPEHCDDHYQPEDGVKKCEHDSDKDCFACRLSSDLKKRSIEPKEDGGVGHPCNAIHICTDECYDAHHTSKPVEPSNWEKEFDEKFDGGYDLDTPTMDNPSAGSEIAHYNELKDFIRTQIQLESDKAYRRGQRDLYNLVGHEIKKCACEIEEGDNKTCPIHNIPPKI